MVGMSAPGDDVVEEYLDQLYSRLRCAPRDARRILAEAEDHLRESVAEGLAAGMTESEAQQHAVSVFGSVRAVVRAHDARRRRAAHRRDLPGRRHGGLAAGRGRPGGGGSQRRRRAGP